MGPEISELISRARREHGQVTVDLGCGAYKRAIIGLDSHSGPGVDIICLAGFEPFPFPDASIDRFYAYDFLEHIPTVAPFVQGGRWDLHYPRIALMGEVHRCLVPGGIFESKTPSAYALWARDPTHASVPWLDESWRYFCGEFPLYERQGLDFAFEMVEMTETDDGYLHVLVRKPAQARP